jgi:hypothetical protein
VRLYKVCIRLKNVSKRGWDEVTRGNQSTWNNVSFSDTWTKLRSTLCLRGEGRATETRHDLEESDIPISEEIISPKRRYTFMSLYAITSAHFYESTCNHVPEDNNEFPHKKVRFLIKSSLTNCASPACLLFKGLTYYSNFQQN